MKGGKVLTTFKLHTDLLIGNECRLNTKGTNSSEHSGCSFAPNRHRSFTQDTTKTRGTILNQIIMRESKRNVNHDVKSTLAPTYAKG